MDDIRRVLGKNREIGSPARARPKEEISTQGRRWKETAGAAACAGGHIVRVAKRVFVESHSTGIRGSKQHP